MEGAYLDHAATSPLRPEAREAMLTWLGPCAANPSGSHRAARAARRAVDDARDEVAASLGCQPGEVVFTSGGTESDVSAVVGVHQARGGTVVCSAAEHHAVLEAVASVGGRIVPVGSDARVDLSGLAGALDEDVSLVSVMAANNEVGSIERLGEVVALVRERAPRAVVHTDAVAAFCWVDVAAAARGVDLISVSAHKFGGPQGVGALVVRPGVSLRPLLVGGGQERNRRSGTHNVAGIAAMAAAVRATVAQRPQTVARIGALRDRLVDTVRSEVDGVVETVPRRDAKVAGSAHLCIGGVDSEALLFLLDRAGVAASAASSCASGAQQRSHVLTAMGVEASLARGALRCSLGWSTTDEEIELATAAILDAVERLRSCSPAPPHPPGGSSRSVSAARRPA